jgi:protein O-mannosyl-transferase
MPKPAPPRQSPDPLRRLRLGLGALIFAITFAAFARSLAGGFSDFDDFAVLFKVDGYRGLAPGNIAWDFSSIHMGHWQPLTWMSYGVDYLIWGIDPKTGAPGFHLTNVLLHGANAVLVYLLAIRLMGAASWSGRDDARAAGPSSPVLLGGAAAALFFSLSPLRVESVAWITERRDVLSTFFLLLAALAYLRAFPPGSVRPASAGSYWLMVALLLLSLLAKSWGMSFFVIATILDIYPLRRLPTDPRRWPGAPYRDVLVQKVPLAVLGLAALLVAGFAQSRSSAGVTRTIEEWGIGERLVQAAYGLYFYVARTIVPVNLSAMYDMPVKLNPLEPRFLVAYAAVIGGVAGIWMLRRRAPGLVVAAACYAVTVAPVLGLFQSGIQFVADRYSYVSCIGWAVLVGAGVAWLLREGVPDRARRGVLTGGGAVIVAGALALGTWIQIGYWSDTLLLWRHAMAVGWDGPTLRQYYAFALEQHKDLGGAEAQYRAAVEMNPNQGGAWYPYANLLRDKGDFAGAELAYRKAAACMTEPWKALTALGLLYLNRLDRPRDAVEVLRSAVADAERAPKSTAGGATGYPYLLLAGALWEVNDLKGCRENLLIAAEHDDTKKEALQRLPEVEAAMRGEK